MMWSSIINTALLAFSNWFPWISGIDDSKPVINTNSGALRGQLSVDAHGNTFYDFRGIPYAEAPVGERRFKSPMHKLPWRETLDATKDGPVCPQLSAGYNGKEDNCLTLNVYTPKLPSGGNNPKLDVVFHIHGGGFVSGSGGAMIYNPAQFMQKDKSVILVSTTYRLASIGFLSTLDKNAPGNYGLLDQLEALRWVQDNIHHFGGDPMKVTLFGESAGSASVMYHLLSPLSKGLFHKAVAMSGSTLHPWAFQPEPMYYAKRLASRVNCTEADSRSMVSCLKRKSAEELIENDGSFEHDKLHTFFSPTLDHNFIHDTPHNLVCQNRYNDVPLLIGVVADEGNCLSSCERPVPGCKEDTIDFHLRTLFNGVTNVDKAMKRVKEKYFPQPNLGNEEVARRLAKVITDYGFHMYFYQTVQLMVQRNSTVFSYMYDYAGNQNILRQVYGMNSSVEPGACHCADVINFFGNSTTQSTPEDNAMRENMQKLFINFIRKGDPNGENIVPWPRATPERLNVYHINTDVKVVEYDPAKDELFKFWVHDIPEILGQKLWTCD